MSGRPILLAAGGTGGHLFPAAALAQELKRRGYEVELATDIRAEKYGVEFPARAIHRIPSATLTSRNPFAVAMTFSQLGIGFFGARPSPEGDRAPGRDWLWRLSHPCRRSSQRAR